MRKLFLPIYGFTISLCFFVTAALRYPGGTTDSSTTVGYSVLHNFVSSLFAPRALNGAANPARYFAVAAMVFLCVSLGFAFKQISTTVSSRPYRKTIEIAGIGSMVYSLLVITPMHDLMVTIGLGFSFVALVATTQWLALEHNWRLAAWGAVCIAITAVSAVMYYGHVWFGILPIVQKVGMVASSAWVLAVYFARLGRSPAPSLAIAAGSVGPISGD